MVRQFKYRKKFFPTKYLLRFVHLLLILRLDSHIYVNRSMKLMFDVDV